MSAPLNLGRATHLVRVDRVVRQIAYIWQEADSPEQAQEAAMRLHAWTRVEVLETTAVPASLRESRSRGVS